MKHKVVGWTFYDNTEIISKNDAVTYAERNAIIDDIRKHQYLFSGWHHQESLNGVVPILNDGKKRCFSQRTWGGIMAEAYGYNDDYAYASFSFNQSILNEKIKYASDDFNIYKFKAEIIQNEHFVINVSEALFDIAKISNPFYLEELEGLRYIDENDSITLCCKGEELTFIVSDVNISKSEEIFKKDNKIIKGKYTLIIKHKPENKKREAKLPIVITASNAIPMFKEALETYNYDVLEELFKCYDFEYLSEVLPCTNSTQSLMNFIVEYVDNSYKVETVIEILKYLNNYELYEQIANKTFGINEDIYISFIDIYFRKNDNIEDYIFNYIDTLKTGEKLSYASINVLFKAICLRPNNKSLRKKYYVAIKDTFYEGLPIMAGVNLFKYLRKEDKRLIELNNYSKYSDSLILKIVELLTFPNNNVKDGLYPNRVPKIYQSDEEVIVDGVKAYQNYIKKHFNLEDILEDMIYHGIEEKCFEMNKYLFGDSEAAKYICSLDILTNYKYNLKEYALMKYSNICENFKEELESVYKKSI